MQGKRVEHLIAAEEPTEVYLSRAPLARVLAQLRFEQLAVLNSARVTDSLTDALSSLYPFMETSAEINMVIAQGQVAPQATPTTVWKFRSADKAATVSLSNGSLAFETTNYRGRSAFCRDLIQLASTFEEAIHVPNYTRLGIRYTNRVSEVEVIGNLAEMVRREVLGISGASFDEATTLQHALSQASLATSNGDGLLAQWGIMPPGGTFDPSLPALTAKSWVLDIDAFYANQEIHSTAKEIERHSHRLASRAYSFFRWAVTEDFLTHFGGSIG